MTTAIVLAIALLVGIVAHQVSHKKDSMIEQLAEAVIKDKAGIDIDFSKESEESSK